MAERAVTSTRRCTVNPLIGRELDGTEIIPSPHPCKVLVAGGGPAGLKAAATAARRGHKVILCEKSDQLGGILKGEKAIPFKYEMYELGVTLERQARDAGVEIRLNTCVTKEYAEKEKVGALIIAVGSEPIIPPIPGLEGDNVIVVNNYYLEKDKASDQVVVLGGGLAGCETAIHLAQEGKDVHLVEMRPELAPDANIRHRPLLLKEIEKNRIHVHTGYKGLRVTEEGVVCADMTGEEHLVPGTTVICALGQKARRDMVEELTDCAPFVAQIGDCVCASTITTAIYQGYHAALDI
jgi:NADPH-dependent 2,4-dienoyl-CoA reductase/sulfur reductase-like enzyme